MDSAATTTHPPALAVLDLRPDGVWAAIEVAGQMISCDFGDTALAPGSLVAPMHVKKTVPGEFHIPLFASVLGRLDYPREVSLPGLPPQTPIVHVENILARLTAGLRTQWGAALNELCLLLPRETGEPQRAQLRRIGEDLAWERVRLVSHTTALAFTVLRDRPLGNYAVALLGQDPLEISIVQWGAAEAKVMGHASSPEVTASRLDHALIEHTLAELRRALGRPVDLGSFSDSEWLLLRRQLVSAQRRLPIFREVSVDLPATLTEGKSARVSFQQDHWRQWAVQAVAGFRAELDRACDEAQIALDGLAGCFIAGPLAASHPVLCELRRQVAPLPLIVVDEAARIDGAVRCMMSERQRGLEDGKSSGAATRKALPKLDHAHVADEHSPQPKARPGAEKPDEFGAVKDLIQSRQTTAARSALDQLKGRLVGLEEWLEATKSRDGSVRTPPSPAPPKTTASPPAAAPAKPIDEAAAKRAYVRAKEKIREAEKALRQGLCEQAVSLSHVAMGESPDPRILQAVIKVHLRAAQKDPPTRDNFKDHRRWLNCALGDERALQEDGSNKDVQQALQERYLVEVEQQTELGTASAHELATEALIDMSKSLPMSDLAARWLSELRAATPGALKLSREEVNG